MGLRTPVPVLSWQKVQRFVFRCICQCFSWMGGEGKKNKYYANENPLVFIKMLTRYTDFVYGIICHKFVSLGCWFFSTTISILRGKWQQYCVSCWVTRTRKGLISGVYIFSVISIVLKFWNSYMWDSLITFPWFYFFFLVKTVIYNKKGSRLLELLSGIVHSFVTFYIFQRSAALQWAKNLILEDLNFSWALLWSSCVVLGKQAYLLSLLVVL